MSKKLFLIGLLIVLMVMGNSVAMAKGGVAVHSIGGAKVTSTTIKSGNTPVKPTVPKATISKNTGGSKLITSRVINNITWDQFRNATMASAIIGNVKEDKEDKDEK